MPQPTRGGSSRTGGGTAKSSPAKKTTARKAPAKRASAGSAAGKPAASRTASKSTRGTAAKPTRATAAKSSRSTAAKPTRSTAAKGTRTSAASRNAGAKRSAASADVRLDAVANRLRKLNERIIDAGREAGESTLTSYEKALKAIATGIEKGPGRSDIDWIAHLATSQAKFIRELTDSWASAARGVLKP
jgi:hypothetical protein